MLDLSVVHLRLQRWASELEHDASKDGLIVTYDSTSNKFILISQTNLDTSTSDSDISDSFVEQLEEELDFGQIQAGDVDGGAF